MVPTSGHNVGISGKTVNLNSAPAATASGLNIHQNGILWFYVGASLTANHGQIGSAGSGILYGGTLSLSFLNGFTPEIGDSFQLFDGFHLEGAFTDILFANPGYEADFDYELGRLVFTVVAPPLPGDYNQDGIVDAADYVVWRDSNGTPEAYDEWRANFGTTAGGGSGATLAAVPEPMGISLAAVAMLFTWCFTSRPGNWHRRARSGMNKSG